MLTWHLHQGECTSIACAGETISVCIGSACKPLRPPRARTGVPPLPLSACCSCSCLCSFWPRSSSCPPHSTTHWLYSHMWELSGPQSWLLQMRTQCRCVHNQLSQVCYIIPCWPATEGTMHRHCIYYHPTCAMARTGPWPAAAHACCYRTARACSLSSDCSAHLGSSVM